MARSVKRDVDLVFVLDQSGSMSGNEKATADGVEEVFSSYRNGCRDARVSISLFSDTAHYLARFVDVADLPKVKRSNICCNGCTALLDAMGFAIEQEKECQNKQGKPDKTIVVVVTDGYENASSYFTYSDIHTLISKCRKKGWEFIFMGANIDVIQEASRLGIKRDSAVSFTADEEGISVVYGLARERCEAITGK